VDEQEHGRQDFSIQNRLILEFDATVASATSPPIFMTTSSPQYPATESLATTIKDKWSHQNNLHLPRKDVRIEPEVLLVNGCSFGWGWDRVLVDRTCPSTVLIPTPSQRFCQPIFASYGLDIVAQKLHQKEPDDFAVGGAVSF
jgi:hypothetical protein